MDKKFIEESINTIITIELDHRLKQRFGSLKGTIEDKKSSTVYLLGSKQDRSHLLVSDPRKETIISDTLEALISLYQKAIYEGVSKIIFFRIFVKVLKRKPFLNVTRLMYFYLILFARIRELQYFHRMIQREFPALRMSSSDVYFTLSMISEIIRFEHEQLDEKDISTLKEIASRIKARRKPKNHDKIPKVVLSTLLPSYVPGVDGMEIKLGEISKLINKQIAQLKFRSLKLILADINPVVNEDKQRSLKILQKLEFPKKFTHALNAIEDYFRKGEFDEQEAATCISKIGSFVQDFNLEVIKRIEQIKGEEFTGKTESVASTIQYLKKKSIGFFDDKIADVYKSIYNLCSATGRHHLVSAKEDARICKNIMIELILLALEKLQKYSSKQNEKTAKRKNV